MSARCQSFVLLLFGAALIRLAATEALLRYVRPVARPWVLLAGVGIVVLALWSLAATRPESPGVDQHQHSGTSSVAWLVIAPVIAVVVIAPPALGAYAAARIPVTAPPPSARAFPPLRADTGGPTRVTLLDFYARAAFDGGATLTGHRVELTGFVLRSDPDGFRIARLVITCCAADARAVVVRIRSPVAAPRPDAWVTVIGEYAGTSPDDRTVPVLRADTVTSVSAPDNPYD
ncbi:MAG TPA: TIGR03943 family protein [Jatrophihabitantaceae bacterium]